MQEFRFNFGAAAQQAQAPLPAPEPSAGPAALLALPSSFAEPFATQAVPGQPSLVQYAVPDADAVSGVRSLDVLPHVYEGGAKLWECTGDLLRCLEELLGGEGLRGARVLDLGCGAGLLGITALKRGAASVTFQDLNAPVLSQVCARNIVGNGVGGAPQAAHLLAGDWRAMLDAAQREAGGASGSGSGEGGDSLEDHLRPGFSLVLSSETLYRPASYAVLCPLLRCLLQRSPNPAASLALFATKRFYFGEGLGGGSALFMEACRSHGLAAATVKSFEDGASNVRDIVRVTLDAC